MCPEGEENRGMIELAFFSFLIGLFFLAMSISHHMGWKSCTKYHNIENQEVDNSFGLSPDDLLEIKGDIANFVGEVTDVCGNEGWNEIIADRIINYLLDETLLNRKL